MNVRAILVGASWLVATGFGFSSLWSYASAPGDPGDPPATWPSDSIVSRHSERPTLLMLAHPRCPCTRASIRELDRLMAQCKDRLSAHVLFYKPAGATADWAKTDLWDHASAIPGVEVLCDDGGQEARRFGSFTSGQVVVYDCAGALLFHGGITAGRGHSGDNFGRAAIVDLVSGAMVDRAETPVYGCPLTRYLCSTSPDPRENRL